MSIEIEKHPPNIPAHSNREIGGNASTPSLSEAQFSARVPRLAFSVRETAETLGVSEKTVRRLVARRLLNPSRALRHLLISRKEVERFLTESSA
jgi:excisionase family DNA binding protein